MNPLNLLKSRQEREMKAHAERAKKLAFAVIKALNEERMHVGEWPMLMQTLQGMFSSAVNEHVNPKYLNDLLPTQGESTWTAGTAVTAEDPK